MWHASKGELADYAQRGADAGYGQNDPKEGDSFNCPEGPHLCKTRCVSPPSSENRRTLLRICDVNRVSWWPVDNIGVRLRYNRGMTEAIFNCPTCEAGYRVVRVQAPPSHNNQLLCLGCGGPLRNRDGRFALKYFRVTSGRNAEPLRKLRLVRPVPQRSQRI